MKKLSLLAIALLLAAGIYSCDNGGGGGGGGLFSSGGYPTENESWDVILMLMSESCAAGAPVSGAGLAIEGVALPPIGYFPGVRVENTSGQYTGTLPEVAMLVYADAAGMGMTSEVAPAEVATYSVVKGDNVKVHFRFQAAADGDGGDYFLVRIVDGSIFHVPIDIAGARMTGNEPKVVDFEYTAKGDGFALEFIVGLSSPTDMLYLDNVKIKVNGEVIGQDEFEFGDYSLMMPVGPTIMRIPFFPMDPAGTVAPEFMVVLSGEQSLGFSGGRTFSLYGQGASVEGYNALMMNLTGYNAETYFGQAMAIKQGGLYSGQYTGTDNVLTPSCVEDGNALVAVNAAGSANLSGLWNLSVLAQCEEPGVFIGSFDLEGNPVPTLYSSPAGFEVYRNLMFFSGTPFTTSAPAPDSIGGGSGISLGSAGMMMLPWAGGQAQLVGSYNAATGIFAGQVMGSLPWNGATCTITQGQFAAMIIR